MTLPQQGPISLGRKGWVSGQQAMWVRFVMGVLRREFPVVTTLHRRTLLLAAEAAGETPTSALQGFGLFYMEWCVWAGHGPVFGRHSSARQSLSLSPLLQCG